MLWKIIFNRIGLEDMNIYVYFGYFNLLDLFSRSCCCISDIEISEVINWIY